MRTKNNPEMPMVPKAHIKNVEHQRDQYKTERENFEQMLNEECEHGYQMEGKYHDMKTERDSLIDDIAVLKANISRLERENRDLKHENKALRIQSNNYFDEWQESEKQRNEFISYVNLYTTLTNHIRMKAENNPGVSRYIDLVNYIDRLESIDDEI